MYVRLPSPNKQVTTWNDLSLYKKIYNYYYDIIQVAL